MHRGTVGSAEEGEYLTLRKVLTGLYADFLSTLMKTLNFTVNLELVPDGKYGSREVSLDNKTRKWSGLIGMIEGVGINHVICHTFCKNAQLNRDKIESNLIKCTWNSRVP